MRKDCSSVKVRSGKQKATKNEERRAIEVLLVEDSPADARMIEELLRESGHGRFALARAGRLSTALSQLVSERPQVLVLDLSLPDSNGVATFRRAHAAAPDLPIVVLTGLDDEEVAVQTVAEGASDYIAKNDLSGSLLVRALRYAIERQRSADALREKERRLAQSQRQAHLGSWEWSKETGIVTWSEELYRITGRDPTRPLPNCEEYAELLMPDSWARANRAICEVLEACSNCVLDLEVRCPDGTKKWVTARAQVEKDPDGKIRLRGTAQDITERRKVEMALAYTQRELALKNEIAKMFLIVPNEEVFGAALQPILEYTDSRTGIFAYVDEEGAVVCPPMAFDGNETGVFGRPARYTRERWMDPWAYALREHKALIWNRPVPAAPGAVSIQRAVVAPLLFRGRGIGFIEIANKTVDYAEADKQLLERISSYIAPLLQAKIERESHERALASALATKEVLLREVHHRVKNNLQIVSSLLSMQADALEPSAAREAFEESQRRVRSMAMVHEQLDTQKVTGEIDFAEYVMRLSRDLIDAYGANPQSIQLRFDLEPVNLGVGLAMPCGLILNELVTNSVKHAFAGGRAGEILVALHAGCDGTITLRVADNGAGLPHGLNYARSNTLGFRIIDILTRQLDGTLALEGGAGADFRLTFPKR